VIGTTTSVVATAGIVAMGQWANDKPITIKFVVGSGVFAVALSIMGEANQKLAEQFGVLVMITAFLIYAVPVAQKLGLVKTKGPLGNASDLISSVLGAR
jgi:hypothetical protein